MIPERKRFAKLLKKNKQEMLSTIIKYYKVNNKVAEQYLNLMSVDQLIELEKTAEGLL